MMTAKIARTTFVLAALLLSATPAGADDVLKVAIGQMDTWVNQAAVLGQRVGIFKKHGIVLENFATQGSGETLQAVISNAAQVGIGVGTLGVPRSPGHRLVHGSHCTAGNINGVKSVYASDVAPRPGRTGQ